MKYFNCLFICSSSKDRSPALVNYFKEVYPLHSYKNAGVNKYFTAKHKTTYLSQDALDWADLIVFAEPIHHQVASKNFELENKQHVILSCGEYAQGCLNDDYLTKAEEILKPYLEIE